MALYVLTAIRMAGNGTPTHAKIQRADGVNNRWVGEPMELSASDVANLLERNDTIEVVFKVDGHSVTAGPIEKQVIGALETFRLSDENSVRTLSDLPRF